MFKELVIENPQWKVDAADSADDQDTMTRIFMNMMRNISQVTSKTLNGTLRDL